MSAATATDNEDLFAHLTVVRALSPLGSSFEILEVRDGRGQRRALKQLRAGREEREDLGLRLRHEGDVLAALSGLPNIIALVAQRTSGSPALMLEVADGGDVAALLEASGGRLSSALARHLGLQLCSVLAAVHSQGIIHRDVKPSNLLLVAGELRLADFGVAAVGHPPRALPDGWEEGVVGTEPYAAPEQVQAGAARITATADVYAAGVTLAAFLGKRLVAGARVPEWLLPALESDPGNRPSSAELRTLVEQNL
jgi:serine/threonine protein kinase